MNINVVSASELGSLYPVTGNPSSVTLRYYSAHYKNLFEAVNALTFANDAHLGTIAEPLVPTLVVVK